MPQPAAGEAPQRQYALQEKAGIVNVTEPKECP